MGKQGYHVTAILGMAQLEEDLRWTETVWSFSYDIDILFYKRREKEEEQRGSVSLSAGASWCK